MSLVYTTVIAIVPLIAIVFSVLKGFGLHEQVEPALLDALSDLGDKRFDIVNSVMGFINNVNVGVLGSLGFAILLFSVISMMQKIERAFKSKILGKMFLRLAKQRSRGKITCENFE